MAHGNNTIPIPGELRSEATEGVVASADAVKDYRKNKFQEQVNLDVDSEISSIKGNMYTKTEGTALEENVNAAIERQDSSILSKFESQDATMASKFNQQDQVINERIDEQDEKIDTILKQKVEVVDVLPETGEESIIYRVPNSEGNGYSDYMWQNNEFKLIGTFEFPGIDDEPTDDSPNVVSSKGLARTYGSYKENPEFLNVTVDGEDKVLEGIQQDGTKVISGDLHVGGSAKVVGETEIGGVLYKVVESPEWLKVIVDAEDKVLVGIKADGTTYIANLEGIDDKLQEILAQFEQMVEDAEAEIDQKIADAEAVIDAKIGIFEELFNIVDSPEYISVELDAEDKVLGGRKIDGTKFENVSFSTPKVSIDGHTIENIEDPKGRSEITTDFENKILSYRDGNGVKHENIGIETNSLILTDEGMTAFQQALKDSGFTSGKGNWSDYISNDGDNPLHLSIPRCAIINITNSRNNAVWPTSKTNNYEYYIEYADVEGNYFKKPIIANAQGNSSMGMPKKNMALDMFDSEWNGDAFSVKFGDWVPQDSFQLKAFYLDLFRCVCPISYKLARQIAKTRGPIDDAFWKREMLPAIGTGTTAMSGFDDYNKIYDNGATGIPDGFPCIVFLNEAFYGVYSFQLKKHRDNYMMSKGNAGHIHLDGCIKDIFKYNGTINWAVIAGTVADSTGNRDGIEFRNPKNLVYAEKHSSTYKYDADAPGQFEIAGNNDGSAVYDTWQAGSYAVGKIVSHNGHIYMNTVADNTAEPIYNKKNNGDDAPDFKNKTGCGWLNVTNTVVVKSSFIALSTYVPELAQMVEDQATDEQIRTKIEQHFDVKGLIDYMLLSVVAGYETAGKNWQWITYDGIKWSVCPWDYDGAFGWDGWGEVSPTANLSVNTTSLNTPLGWIYSYFNAEVKQRYEELRNKKVIELQSIWSMFEEWLNAVGADNYGKDLDKWPCDKDHYSGMSVYHYDNKYRLYNWVAARIEKCDTIFEYNS